MPEQDNWIPLAAAGVAVVALEPSPRLRGLLRRKTASDARVAVRGDLFEDYRGEEAPFAAVVSANAFHWIDPRVSYSKAAALLEPAGSIALIWNYPLLVDAGLQDALNKHVFAGRYPDFVQEASSLLHAVEHQTAEGREELRASGRFDEPWWRFYRETFALDVPSYVELLASYASDEPLPPHTRELLAEEVRSVVKRTRAEDALSFTNHVYLVVARRLPANTERPQSLASRRSEPRKRV